MTTSGLDKVSRVQDGWRGQKIGFAYIDADMPKFGKLRYEVNFI